MIDEPSPEPKVPAPLLKLSFSFEHPRCQSFAANVDKSPPHSSLLVSYVVGG